MKVALMIACLAGSLFVEPRNEIVLELRGVAAIPRNLEGAFATRSEGKLDFCDKLSNDKGRTWFEWHSRWGITQGVPGLLKTGAVATALSQAFSWARIDLELKYEFRFADDGLTWSAPRPRPLKLPLPAASTERLPESWNPTSLFNGPFDPGMRRPLAVTLSQDSGLTWPTRRLMKSDTRDSCHYILVHRLDDGAFIACSGGDDVMAKLSSPLRIRRIKFGFFPQFSALAQFR